MSKKLNLTTRRKRPKGTVEAQSAGRIQNRAVLADQAPPVGLEHLLPIDTNGIHNRDVQEACAALRTMEPGPRGTSIPSRQDPVRRVTDLVMNAYVYFRFIDEVPPRWDRFTRDERIQAAHLHLASLARQLAVEDKTPIDVARAPRSRKRIPMNKGMSKRLRLCEKLTVQIIEVNAWVTAFEETWQNHKGAPAELR